MTATMPLSEMCWMNPCESYPLSAITYSPSYPEISPGDQHLSLSDVVLLSWGQLESQWIAKSVHAHVNLGAESSTASAEGL